MARLTELCWEMLGRTDSRLINTRKELTDTRKELANLKEGFEKEIARLEKIIKDLLG